MKEVAGKLVKIAKVLVVRADRADYIERRIEDLESVNEILYRKKAEMERKISYNEEEIIKLSAELKKTLAIV